MGNIRRKSSRAISKTPNFASQAVPEDHKTWAKNFARFGMAAKGVVYGLLGTLAVLAAFNMGGGQTTNKKGIIKWLAQQPFGQILLGLLAAGLLCYVIWRFYQAFADPENDGKDAKGMIKRIGHAISGIVYGAIAFYAAKLLFDTLGSSGSGGNTKQTLVGNILSQPTGQWIVGIIGLIIIGKGLYDIYSALSGKFKEKLNESRMSEKERKVYTKAGYAGYIARGIVFLIIGFFFIKAGVQSDASEAQGTAAAFDFLQNTGGNLIMGGVALGLLAYGVFMIIKAKSGDVAIH